MLASSTSASSLYSISLGSGLATNLGQIDGGVVISAMTIAPESVLPEPGSVTLIGLTILGLAGRKRR